MSRGPVLDEGVFTRIDGLLRDTDRMLESLYPGSGGQRQPVHTVYIPADTWTPDLTKDWGARALQAVEEHGGMESLADRVMRRSGTEPGGGLRRRGCRSGRGRHCKAAAGSHRGYSPGL